MKWICDRYEKSIYGEKVSSLIGDYDGYFRDDTDELPIIFLNDISSRDDFKRVNALTQIEWLLWRTYVDYKRNLSTIFLRFIFYMVN